MAVLVGIANYEADGGACGFSFKHAREHFHSVLLPTGGGQRALPWPTSVEFALHKFHIDVDACGHSVNHATDGCAVAFAEGGQLEEVSKRISHQ